MGQGIEQEGSEMVAFIRAIRDHGRADWSAILVYPNWLLAACWLTGVCVAGFYAGRFGWQFVIALGGAR